MAVRVIMILFMASTLSCQGASNIERDLKKQPKDTSDGASLCDQNELWDRLNMTLADSGRCSTSYDHFLQTIMDSSFDKKSIDEQNQVLHEWCRTRCGKDFDRVVNDWHHWCTSNDSRYDPIPRESGPRRNISMKGPIITFGCARPMGLFRRPQYCAKAFTELTNHATTDQNVPPKCAFFQTCCYGEMSTFVKGQFAPPNCIGTRITGNLTTCLG